MNRTTKDLDLVDLVSSDLRSNFLLYKLSKAVDFLDLDLNRMRASVQELLQCSHQMHIRPDRLALSLLLEILEDPVDRKAIETALDMAGFTGQIRIASPRKGLDRYVIELVEGHVFNVKRSLKSKRDILTNTKVVLFDGYIESVSEIYHVCQTLAETHDTCVMFARGFSDDVINTVSVNNVRNTFDVTLCSVPFDVEGANVLSDIACVTGSDVISSLKGETLSSLDVNVIARVPSVTFIGDSCTIVSLTDTRAKRNVTAHVTMLKEKLRSVHEMQVTATHNRIRSLASRCVVVTPPDDSIVTDRIERLKHFLSLYRLFVRGGLTQLQTTVLPTLLCTKITSDIRSLRKVTDSVHWTVDASDLDKVVIHEVTQHSL